LAKEVSAKCPNLTDVQKIAAQTAAGQALTRAPFTWPPRPFFEIFESGAIDFANSLQRRLVA
jgi:hypothetical protein